MKSINRLEYLLAFVTFVFAVIVFISLLPRNVLANGDFDLCGNNHEFTADFLIEGCQFKANGATPYFILTSGFQRILATPDGAEEPEMSIETVLCKTKTINLDGRLIKTRVYEERALECEEGECETVEISLNWFAICKQTGDVYYFGEESKDCEYGFDENDECCNEEDVCGQETTGGSWEAGVNGAIPGIMMPGTFLLGAKYFQEIALNDDYFIERKLYPNVDFYSGLIYKAIGVPTNMFTVMFSIARTVGWVSQWMEMIGEDKQRIGRPRQLYVGPARRDYIPIKKRK